MLGVGKQITPTGIPARGFQASANLGLYTYLETLVGGLTVYHSLYHF